mgnify:CR=1 FL=1
MIANKFFTLYKHPTATTAAIIYTTIERFDHFYEELYNTGRCIKLSAFFTFGISKLSQEVFVHASK